MSRVTVSQPVRPAGKADEKSRAQFEQQVRDGLNTEARFKVEFSTDATGLTTMWSDEMPTDAVWRVTITVTGRSTDGAQTCVYERRGQFSRGSGDASLLGSVDTIGTDYESDAALDVALTADSTGPLLQVNGSTYSMTWKAIVKIAEVR